MDRSQQMGREINFFFPWPWLRSSDSLNQNDRWQNKSRQKSIHSNLSQPPSLANIALLSSVTPTQGRGTFSNQPWHDNGFLGLFSGHHSLTPQQGRLLSIFSIPRIEHMVFISLGFLPEGFFFSLLKVVNYALTHGCWFSVPQKVLGLAALSSTSPISARKCQKAVLKRIFCSVAAPQQSERKPSASGSVQLLSYRLLFSIYVFLNPRLWFVAGVTNCNDDDQEDFCWLGCLRKPSQAYTLTESAQSSFFPS